MVGHEREPGVVRAAQDEEPGAHTDIVADPVDSKLYSYARELFEKQTKERGRRR